MVSLASEFPNDNPSIHCGAIWICDDLTGPPRASLPLLPPVAPRSVAELAPEPEAEFELDAAAIEAAPATEAEAAPEARFDSLAPPEDDQADAALSPILVEELEPLEDASLEGELVPGPSSESAAASLVDSVVPVFDEVVTVSPVPNDDSSSALPPAPEDPFTILVCTLADIAIGAGSPHVASMLPGLLFDARLPETLDGEVLETLRAAGICNDNEVTPGFVAITSAWRAILRGTSDDFDACGAAMLDEWASDLLARLLSAPARAPALRQELRSRGVAAFGLAA